MEFYYILYWSFFASIIGELLPLKQKKIIMMIWCVIFILIGGLRWRIGGDWDQYYDHFLFSKWSNIFSYDRYGTGLQTLEPGFVFVNVLIKSIFGTFYFYNFILCSFVQLTNYKFSTYFFRERPLLCYMFLTILANGLFPVRAGFSLAITFWCWRFIKERNLKKYLMVVTAAFFIHNQAIVLFPCYFLGYIKLKSKVLLVIYPIIAIFAFRFQDFFAQIALLFDDGSMAAKLQTYTGGQTEGFSTTQNFLGWAFNYFFLINYLIIRKMKALETDFFYNVLLNAFMIYNSIFMIFAAGMGDLARAAAIYFPAQCLLFNYAIQFFLKLYKGKFELLVALFLLSYLAYRTPALWSGYFFKAACVPYKTIYDYRIV